MRHFFLLILTILMFACQPGNEAPLELSLLVSDHMVLQRGQENKIWGWAGTNQSVKATFQEATYEGKADETGRWEITLPAMEAGGPYEMTISDGKTEKAITDILIGEVWICSGQSNMEWILANTDSADTHIPQANDPLLRHIKIPREGSDQPTERLPGGAWEPTTPETAGNFTAVGYYFAKQLREKLDVPVGLINSTWGGSSVEAWTSATTPLSEEVTGIVQGIIEDQKMQRKESMEKLGPLIAGVTEKDRGYDGEEPIWASPEVGTDDWNTMKIPGLWEEKTLPGLDGVVWFKKDILLEASSLSEKALIALGKIDDSDEVWINGTFIDGMEGAYNADRRYEIPNGLLKAGLNNITVKVTDTGGGGGIYGQDEDIFLQIGDQKMDLSGEWKFKIGSFKITIPRTNQAPSKLYNRMIHPMLGYGMRGVIWYQGESNAGGRRAYTYREQFGAMIKDWREKWGIGDFPFLYVQLANFRAAHPTPTDSDWAVLRESQSKVLEAVKNTGQAVIIDIGEADDIHPRNKRDVGYRLSLAARKLAYNEDLVYSGPMFKSMEINGNLAKITFDHVGSGLMIKADNPQGFAIAGADKVFYWANAILEGNTIVLSSSKVPNPVAVRYAWSDNPDNANLYNKEALPASPFRTDDW